MEFIRYEGLRHDARRITDRAGGGRIAWFQDPDGNTFAVEADDRRTASDFDGRLDS